MVRPFILLLALWTWVLPVNAAFAVGEAGEAYAYPNFAELIQSIMVLGGLDVKDNRILDEYIKLMYCDIYRDNYKNDFSYNGVRTQILSRITKKKEYYRSLFQVGGAISIGQYDFASRQFPLTEKTSFQNVGYMSLFEAEDFESFCLLQENDTNAGTTMFPKDINIILNEPFTLTGLKISPKEAEQVLAVMQKLGIDEERKIYIRFRFRVQSIAESKKIGNGRYSKTDLSGELVGADIFYDKEMTRYLMNVPVR